MVLIIGGGKPTTNDNAAPTTSTPYYPPTTSTGGTTATATPYNPPSTVTNPYTPDDYVNAGGNPSGDIPLTTVAADGTTVTLYQGTTTTTKPDGTKSVADSSGVVTTTTPDGITTVSTPNNKVTSVNIAIGSATSGGISAPGTVVRGGLSGNTGVAQRARFLGGSKLNTDDASVWFRFNFSFATSGVIKWTVLPPEGVTAPPIYTDPAGTDVYFDASARGIYKVVAEAQDANGSKAVSYTQVASLGGQSGTTPPFDLTWTGSTVPQTTTPVVDQPSTDPSTGGTGSTPVNTTPSTATPAARYFSSTAVELILERGVNPVATQLTLPSTTGLPTKTPYTLILDYGSDAEEIVTVTAATGLLVTIKRGEDGTAAVSHSNGAKVRHGITARDLQEPQQHLASSSNVHGISGSVVGTTDAQSLSNKVLDGTVNTFRNIPAAALGADVITPNGVATLTGKVLDGSKNTFQNIPASALAAGVSGTVTADNTASFSNKTIDGSLNTFKNIPYSALQNAPSGTTGTTAVQPRYWYLNGGNWIAYTTAVADTRALVLFQLNLGNVDPGVITVSAAATIQVQTDARVDFFIDAGNGVWTTRRRTAFDGTGFGSERLANSISVPNFYWPGGQLQIRAVAQRISGAGTWKNQTQGSYAEILWTPMSTAPVQPTNLATANQTA